MRLHDLHTPLDTLRWVMVWAVLYSAYAWIARLALRRLGPRLNESARKAGTTQEGFCREAAQCVVAITSHVFLGPTALWLAVQYMFAADELGLSVCNTENIDPVWLRREMLSYHTGEVFVGNMVYQLLYWLLRWETGVDTLLHHLGFLIAGVLVLAAGCYARLAMSAIAMEVSSPFLSLHVLCRQLEGKWCSRVSDAAKAMFVAVFFVVRIGFYGHALAKFHTLYWRHWDMFPREVPSFVTAGILVSFTAGWLLQLVWAKMVLAKALKALRPGRKRA